MSDTAVVAALRELVRLKDIKEHAEREIAETSAASQIADALLSEYEEAKGPAWAAARAALQGHSARNSHTAIPDGDRGRCKCGQAFDAEVHRARDECEHQWYQPLGLSMVELCRKCGDPRPVHSAGSGAEPCCGEWETCTRACTPRGRELGKREAESHRAGDVSVVCTATEPFTVYGTAAGTSYRAQIIAEMRALRQRAIDAGMKLLTVEEILGEQNREGGSR